MNYYNNLWVFKCLEILLIIVGLPGDVNTSLHVLTLLQLLYWYQDRVISSKKCKSTITNW